MGGSSKMEGGSSIFRLRKSKNPPVIGQNKAQPETRYIGHKRYENEDAWSASGQCAACARTCVRKSATSLGRQGCRASPAAPAAQGARAKLEPPTNPY